MNSDANQGSRRTGGRRRGERAVGFVAPAGRGEPHGTDPLGVLSTANIARLVIQANRLEGDPVCRCGQPGPG